jgi:hypothetical protein
MTIIISRGDDSEIVSESGYSNEAEIFEEVQEYLDEKASTFWQERIELSDKNEEASGNQTVAKFHP